MSSKMCSQTRCLRDVPRKGTSYTRFALRRARNHPVGHLTDCRGYGPKIPRRSCSLRSCRLSHTFWRLSKMFRQIFNNLQASLQDTYNNRQHTIAQAGGETHSHANTHAAARCCSHTGENFPNNVYYRTIQMVQCIAPDAASNLTHYLAGVYSNDHRWVLAK